MNNRLTRRRFGQAVGAGAVSAMLGLGGPAGLRTAAGAEAAPAPGAAGRRRPNIVFILADDLGWADLGCYGNKFNETPRLDRLAGQGARFTDFYAAAPVCSPTRASIMSGQYQARFGLTCHIYGHWRPFEKLVEPPNALRMPPEIITIAERLAQAGYATGHFGKWHLGGAPGASPKDQGFQVALEVGGHVIGPKRQDPPSDKPRRSCDYLADKAVAFMEANRDKPFFIHLTPQAVHIPLDTTPELAKKYTAKPKVPGYLSHPLYAGLLEELDAMVGKVVDALDRLHLAEDTLLVFTSDNGGLEREVGGWPGTTNEPLRGEKGSLYEGGIRVPAIIRWPGHAPAGAVCHATACSIDFYPTFLEAAGLIGRTGVSPVPPEQPLDGLSLCPLLKDPQARLDREAIYWHYPHYHHSRPSGAIRCGDLKLIEFFDTGELELYDLRADIGETKNLAPQRPEKVKELHERLKRWRASVCAQMPQGNPGYDPKRANEWWDRRTMQPTLAPGFYK